MTMTTYLTELLSYLVFVPAAALCLLPMRGLFRYGERRTLLAAGILLAVLLPLLALADCLLSSSYNVLLFPCIPVLFLVYCRSLSVPFSKSLSVFVLVCALFSFLANFSNGFDAALHPNATIEQFSLSAAIFQLCLCTIFTLLAAWPALCYGNWLIRQFHVRQVWYISAAVFSVFLIYNIVLYPRKYETLHTNKVFQFYWISLSLMLTLLLLLCVVFYLIVREMLEMARTEERNRILEMEESQFRMQQKYMEESASARHDFRHAIGVLDELLQAGDPAAAQTYLKEYIDTAPRNETVRYCDNLALNALLNYYARLAGQHHIRLKWVIDLPDDLPVSNVDLCGIVGNILDNAITACLEIPEEERWIRLVVSSPNDVRFGIVAANSFSGHVRQDKGRYLSTHHLGSGYGLRSIASAADRYGGTANFHHEGREFCSGIVIPMKPAPAQDEPQQIT